MKKLIVLFPLLLALIVPNCVDAQRLIGKELKSSDPSLNNDDKVYQWVMYTYVMGTDTLDAAFDINGNRITPNGYRPKRFKGVYYCGGGVFGVKSKKKGKFGFEIVSGYDTDGKCIFPLTLMELLDCFSINHIGYGLFEMGTIIAKEKDVYKYVYSLYNKKRECLIPKEMGFEFICIMGEEDLKYISCDIEFPGKKIYEKAIKAVYDLEGKVVMPKSWGYTSIYYSEGYWHCEDASENKVTYSKDLKYVADGYYDKDYASKFNQKKRSNPNYNGPYNFIPNYNSYTPQQPQTQQPQQQQTTRSASSATSHQNSTATASSTNDKFGLKYSGNYISDANTYDIYTGSLASSGWELNHTVEIYDDYIIVDKSKYEFVRMNGSERVYNGNSISFSGTSSQSYYYVDAIYNIREITDFSSMYGSSRFQCRWRKEGGAAPAQPQYNNGYNSGYNNTYNNSYQQPQQQQTPAYQKPAQSKDCTICHGSGKCNTCNGKGYYTNLGIGSGTHPCPNCPNHSGRCQWCNGTGKQ